MYKTFLGVICSFIFTLSLSLYAQSPQEKGLQSISRTSAKAIVGFLADDELLECTPKSLRIRKRELDHAARMRQVMKKRNQG